MTRLPDRSASWTCIRAVPVRSRRCWRASRIALSARTRPSLRVRRASTPFRIHVSSWASFLSKRACCRPAGLQSGRDLVVGGPPLTVGDLLGQAGDAEPLLTEHFALVGRDGPFEQPEQGALPLAVAPEEADPFPPLDLEFDVIQQP